MGREYDINIYLIVYGFILILPNVLNYTVLLLLLLLLRILEPNDILCGLLYCKYLGIFYVLLLFIL